LYKAEFYNIMDISEDSFRYLSVNIELYGSIIEDYKDCSEGNIETVALVTFSRSFESNSNTLDVKPPPNPPPIE